MKKTIFTALACLVAWGAAKADTRLIGSLDVLDVWQFNYSASHWVEQGNLQAGQSVWGENIVPITTLSKEMAGADWIQTAFSSRSFTDPVIATFRVKEDSRIYIAHSDGVCQKPAWMLCYTPTDYKMESARGDKFTFYTRIVRKGETVTLGPNGSTIHPMYVVAAQPLTGTWPVRKPSGAIFDVTTYGAKGDNKTVNTAAIQKAIDACAAAKGGGTVYVSGGIFVTGTIRLKDNVTLWVDEGTILRGSTNHADYPPVRFSLPSYRGHEDYQLIGAENAKNVTITGGGIIDGYSLYEGWPWRGSGNEHERPRTLRLFTCKDVNVHDITIIRSANWTSYYEGCERLKIHNVTFRCYTGTHNQDGIDISGCRDVDIRNINGTCGDDVIVIKSMSLLPVENVYVDGVLSRYANCYLIKIGTETHSPVRNMHVTNVEGWTRYSLAVESVDGAIVENILYENVRMYNCSSPFVIRLGNRGRVFDGGPKPAPVGQMRNITFRNISNTDIRYDLIKGGPGVGAPIAGFPGHMVENVTIEDCDLLFMGSINEPNFIYRDVPEVEGKYPEFNMFGQLPAYGLYFRHVDGLKLRNVKIRARYNDVRPAVVMDDVKNYSVSGIEHETFSITTPSPMWHKQDGEIKQ